ncbi:MarR family transcriptional regulator [Actinomadura macrotermitis]|uniref:Uncharacterized protein n=1 Tax=Actinomadura macrotermitis TaxID=2585200 RepID=A0A7K0BRC9_9ACTN|nr:MarR family transcriptional regulator [Actinomadura macrotermitis]MQY03740.1 hypothetical protein [Actinomadura macrotermitis]
MPNTPSTLSTPDTLNTLNSLTIKGLAQAAELSRATGTPEPELAARLEELAAAGLVRQRTGRISGWSVTPEGRAHRDELLRAELAEHGAHAAVEAAYTAFLPLNDEVKALCTRWQADRDETAARTALDGIDAALPSVLAPVLAGPAAALPRYGRYVARLAAAAERFRSGEPTALTAPRTESFHDIWMELHADLLATLGRTRTSADG